MSDVAYKPTPAEVKQLRDLTQAGMMDCKRALEEAEGDMDAAVKLLREKGIAQAGKRAGRGTGEGIVETYIHAGGKIGAMVEVGCETDFVIPGNDDAIRASALIMRVLADGVAEGRNRGVKVSDFAVQDGDGTEAGEAEAEPAAEPAEPGAEPAEPAAEAPAEAAPAEEATPSEEASE